MLNDTQCRTAKPKAKPYKLPDGNGLYLEVKPNGAKAWRYRFKLAKDGTVKESMFAIGDYASAPSGETPEAAKARQAGGALYAGRGQRGANQGAGACEARDQPRPPSPA